MVDAGLKAIYNLREAGVRGVPEHRSRQWAPSRKQKSEWKRKS